MSDTVGLPGEARYTDDGSETDNSSVCFINRTQNPGLDKLKTLLNEPTLQTGTLEATTDKDSWTPLQLLKTYNLESTFPSFEDSNKTDQQNLWILLCHKMAQTIT